MMRRDEADDMKRLSRAKFAAIAIVWALASWASPSITAAGTDYFPQRIPRPVVIPPGRAVPQHAYLGDSPASWARPMHWRYNNTDAPGDLGAVPEATIQQISDAAAAWTAVCGVQIVFDGTTTSNSPGILDQANVIGWRVPASGVMAETLFWTELSPQGDDVIVDADIMLSPTTITDSQLLASVITHEWGHVIGLGHSPASDTLMSGPPDSAYTGGMTLTPDDVQGCRCLYGPPVGVQAGYVCSLPSKIDFGAVETGRSGATHQLSVTNDGIAAMRIQGIRVGGNDFEVTNNTCAAGMTLAPGASCSVGLRAAPQFLGVTRMDAVIDTSEGPYRIPLRAEGIPFVPSLPPTLNFEGAWWNAPAGSESGWGLTLAHQDDVIFATWFTYDTSGKPLWLTMAALRTSENTFTGTLTQTTGPSLETDPFDPNQVQRANVGNASLRFTDADNGTFAYTYSGVTQSKPITRLTFGPLPTCTFGGAANTVNFQGNWWTASGAESGWGMYFTHQGDVIFASWFAYDVDGTPLWLTATARRSGTGYAGDVIRTTGPAFDAVPFDSQSVTRSPIGTMTLNFADGNNAAFAYTVTIGSPAFTINRFKQLTRLVFRGSGTFCR